MPLPIKEAIRACGVAPPSFRDPVKSKGKSFALVSKDAWDLDLKDFSIDPDDHNRLMIKYGFIKSRGWTQHREDAVRYTVEKHTFEQETKRDFETWEDWANIVFAYRSQNDQMRYKDAQIRVSFEPGSSWSAVGKAANAIADGKPTLNLGWLKDQVIPSPEDRSTILHEFGHALGMMHEHQSPARGEYIHLKELEIYRYYLPLLGSRATVKSQIIDTYNESKIMNMSKLDMESIMMYFMPGYLNEEGIDIPVNTKLSKLDKAFIMLNYPPDLAVDADKKRFMQAMIDAGVTDNAAGEIFGAFKAKKHADEGYRESLATSFQEMRKRFSEYNKGARNLRNANAQLLNSVDHESLPQFGIRDFLGNVINNKLFQSIVKSVVKNTLLQRGIPLKDTIPGAPAPEVAHMIGGLALHPQVEEYVKVTLSKLQPRLWPKAALHPADISQCVLDLLRILGTPGRPLSPTRPAGSDAGRFDAIIPALLQLLEMVESGDPSEEPLEELITQEELGHLQTIANRGHSDNVPMDVQSGILTKLPGIQNILSWFSRTASEGRIDVREITPSATNKMLDMLRKCPPQNIFQEVYSLCFASTFVHDVNGTQKDLQTKLQELLESLLPQFSKYAETGATSTQKNGWELVWGPVIWKVDPTDNSGGPDLAWYIAYNGSVICRDDDEPRPTYVIAIAGTQTRSVHTWLNSNFDVTAPINFKSWASTFCSNPPYRLNLQGSDVDGGSPYIARGTARTVWQLLTEPAPAGAKAATQSLLDFLKSHSHPDLRLVTTGHSLGGALSPTLALTLVEALSIPPDRILTYPIAGPSPGDNAFATLFSERLRPIPTKPDDLPEDKKYQVWNYNLVNKYDPVPQAWCADERACPRQNLQNILNIIPESFVKTVFSTIIDSVVSDLGEAGVRYIPLRSQIFSASPSESFKDVRPQHTEAYHKYVGITPPDLLEALR